MSDKSDDWKTKAAVAAGAAVGSAAIAAALLFIKRRKSNGDNVSRHTPPHPENAPETD